MMKALLLLCALTAASARAACSDATQATTNKWSEKAVSLKAGDSKGKAPELALDTKVNLALLPQAQVTLATAPAQSKVPAEKAFAGLLKVSPVEAGIYEVALGARVWVELIDAGTGKAKESSRFKKGEVSSGAAKTIAFPLEAGRLYFLQVTSASSGTLAMLVHGVAKEQ